MGDHGFRMDFSWGGTDQGKTEATMPALSVLAPQQFRNQYPDKAQDKRTLSISYFFTETVIHHKIINKIMCLIMFPSQNLIKNTKFLTSNFDGHLMLQDILALSLGKSTKELFAERKNKLGVSLFSEVGNRTCQEAGVPLMYCCCNNGREKMEPDDPIIMAIAEGVLEDINQYLRLVVSRYI